MATATRVLFSATSYPRSEEDWQGVFIRRMANALAAREDLRIRMWVPPGPRPERAGYVCSRGDSDFLAALATSGGIAHAIRTSKLLGLRNGAELVLRLQRAFARNAATTDVFHVNWLQCVLGLAGTRTPVLATVLGSDLALLESPPLCAAVNRVLRRRRSVVCPNAQWMVAPLRARLAGSGARVECVPFGIDEAWYGISPAPVRQPRVWLVVLRLTRDKLGPLFEWTRDLDHSRHEIHLLGPMQESLEVPSWVHYHGPVSPARLLDVWFPRASGLISLSRHAEGMPQVLLEAMAASLPIVCSRIPAHEDLVTHGVTGRIVDTRGEFLEALEQLGDGEAGAEVGRRARAAIRESCGSWTDCAARYARHYHELLGARQACAS